MKARIRLFSDFCNSYTCINNYVNTYNLHNNNKYILVSDDSYTHAILLNTVQPKLMIPKEQVIGLALEPILFLQLTKTFVNYARKHIGKYFLGIKGSLPDPFIEYYSYMWHLPDTFEKRAKTKPMSIIVSRKTLSFGHMYRKVIVNKILDTDLNIDIYGNDSKSFGNDLRIKGSFHSDEPYNQYQFTIAIENTPSNDYISEKYCNGLKRWCIPIYYGAKNITTYFGNKWGYRLTGNISHDFDLIKSICADPHKYEIDLTDAHNSLTQEGGKAHFSELIDMLLIK